MLETPTMLLTGEGIVELPKPEKVSQNNITKR